MNRRVLSLDLGTASIGWAVREKQAHSSFAEILGSGVVIFEEGFGTEKGKQFSLAAARRQKRLIRRQYHRRRQRKRKVLGLLIQAGMVPISREEVKAWVSPGPGKRSAYPKNPEFNRWLRLQPSHASMGDTAFTDIYKLRTAAVKGQLDQFKNAGYDQQFLLGRVIYNYAHRRGFLSNAKLPNEKDTGKVKEGISELRTLMNGQFLCEYFANLNPLRDRIRARYVAREMYQEEYDEIWRRYHALLSGLDKEELSKSLFKARPLKSQKERVGPCVFEPRKRRVHVSHPDFEWFRLLQFLQNIRVGQSRKEKFPLEAKVLLDIAQQVIEKFSGNFTQKQLTELISKELGSEITINTENKFPARACPTIHILQKVMGKNWQTKTYSRAYVKGNLGMHTAAVGYHEMWHFLTEVKEYPDKFKSDTPILDYALALGLPVDKAELLQSHELETGYASMSLCAMKAITPFMEVGHPYHFAVSLAGVQRVLGKQLWAMNAAQLISDAHSFYIDLPIETALAKAYNHLLDNLKQFGEIPNPSSIRERLQFHFGTQAWKQLEKEQPHEAKSILGRLQTWLEEAISLSGEVSFKPVPTLRDFIQERTRDELRHFGMSEAKIDMKVKALYHHSEISKWKSPQQVEISDEQGVRHVWQLQTPYSGAVENPAAMRTLHEAKKLVNYLLRQGMVDENTSVIVEMGRELNDMNKRKAIAQWNSIQEQEKTNIREFLMKELQAQPSEDQLSRARMWLEQIQNAAGEIERSLLDKRLLGSELKGKRSDSLVLQLQLWHQQKGICLYSGRQISISDVLRGDTQLEHTIPRSLSNDTRMENLTLATGDANRKKGNRFPAQLTTSQPGLDDHATILLRIRPWEDRIKDLEKQIDKKSMAAKARKREGNTEAYNNAIIDRWVLKFEKDYWADKVRRFKMEEVNEGFARRNLVDMQVITKYAIGWLKTCFTHVRGTKGELTALLRKEWHLQKEYEKKDRTEHTHHMIDALVNAYVDAGMYSRLAAYFRAHEEKKVNVRLVPPWDTFAHDVSQLASRILIHHVYRDRFKVHTKRKQKGADRPNSFIQGEGARASLHMDTALAHVRSWKMDAQGKVWPVLDREGNIAHIFATRKAVDDKLSPIFPKLSEYIQQRKEHIKSDQLIMPVFSLKLVAGGRIRIQDIQAEDIVKLKLNEINAWFIEEVNEKGLRAVKENGFFIPMRKVRIGKAATQPPAIREVMQAFQNEGRPHKHWMYYENESNYALAIYQNHDGKKPQKTFKLVSCLEAAKNDDAKLFPRSRVEGGKVFVLDGPDHGPRVYKIGQRLLLYQDSPVEIWDDPSPENLSKRLYTVTGLSRKPVGQYVYGRINLLLHNQTGKYRDEKGVEADYKPVNGVFDVQEKPPVRREMLHTQINALIEGQDFGLAYDGQIQRL